MTWAPRLEELTLPEDEDWSEPELLDDDWSVLELVLDDEELVVVDDVAPVAVVDPVPA